MSPGTARADQGRDSGGPIYIAGLDRSGKTTMRDFLHSHPSIAIPAVGSNMWTYFYRRFGDLSEEDNLDRCLDAMLAYKHVRFLQPDRERIRREFREGRATYGRLFSLFLAHYAEREGKQRWGAQTGLVERRAEELFAEYPGLKVVHMIRDPRDRYEASLALWPTGRGRAGGATARWRYSVRLAEQNLARHPQDYLVVRFEDMVLDTEATVRRVCAFLGEEFLPEMLDMPGDPKHRDELRSRAGGGGHLLSPDFVGRFRGRVPPEEVAFIQAHAGGLMRRWGYEPEPQHLSPRAVLRFALVEWPNQVGRMVAWTAVETAQQRFPRLLGPDPRPAMILREAST